MLTLDRVLDVFEFVILYSTKLSYRCLYRLSPASGSWVEAPVNEVVFSYVTVDNLCDAVKIDFIEFYSPCRRLGIPLI